METQENQIDSKVLDTLLGEYKARVEEWVLAIREEEKLAVPDHSMRDWDIWERARLNEEEAQEKALEARERYEDALRKSLLNF